ncbi:sulfurtransferase [Streptomyces sp. NPDC002814]
MNEKSVPSSSALVSTDWLSSQLGSSDLLVIDSSVLLAASAPHLRPMRDAYLEAHIPGAVFADLVNEVVEPDSPLGITRPSTRRAEAVFGRLGVGPRTRVVVYDCEFGQNAARLWWLLKANGHDAVALLDGGIHKWADEGRTVESGPVAPVPATFVARPRPGMWSDRQQVLDAVNGMTDATLVNAVPDLPADPSVLPAGAARVMSTTLPGSVDIPFPSMGQPGTTTLPYPSINWPGSPMLRSGPDRAGRLTPVPRGRPAIVYCNSGLNAPLVGLCLVEAGYDAVSVYDGGLMEWLGDPKAPVTARAKR